MITEDYCSFELSKLLKEKGFDWDCRCYYFSENNERYYSNEVPRNNHKLDADLACPTHQMVMKWLREKWIFIEIPFSVTTNGEPCYNFGILSRSAQWVYRHKQFFSTYEEAVEAAIKYSLENLI